MSYTTTYASLPAQTMVGKLHDLMDRFQTHRANQRAIRQTFNELSAMNDRDLADIGVARGEIREIASQATALR